jgi:uncharacterized membrane protein (UPF0127 family)
MKNIVKVGKGKGKVLWKDVEVADSFLKHVKGIMFMKSIEKPLLFIFKEEAPISIHSYFCVTFDIVYADKFGKVTEIIEKVRPDSVLPTVNCKYIIECSAGEIRKKRIMKGDKLAF